MKLKQIALVAKELETVRAQFFNLLGLGSDYVDPGVGAFGLTNTVMPIGETFLEVVSPIEDGTTAGRLLDRRGGDGGYMVISLVDDFSEVSRRLDDLGMRKVWEIDRDDVSACHVHPKDIGAAIVSFDEMRPATEWWWAGPDWRARTAANVSAISGVDIQAVDPEDIAGRWSKAFNVPAQLSDGAFVLELEEGVIRVLEAKDGRGDGVAGVQFDVSDKAAVLKAADEMGLVWNQDETVLCGTVLRFRGLV